MSQAHGIVWRWWMFVAQHVNVRNDRYEAFTTLLNAGRFELTYIALATTAGEFAAPPTRAEEMYAPETFGRGRGERVVVR
jgi:alpha-2-macroglobulin